MSIVKYPVLLISAVSILLLAACQQQAQPTAEADISLHDASDSQLHSRMQTTCVATQEKLAAVSYDDIWPRCECYATRTLKVLDSAEKNVMRATNVFNETAKAKALASVDSCKLRRPNGV